MAPINATNNTADYTHDMPISRTYQYKKVNISTTLDRLM